MSPREGKKILQKYECKVPRLDPKIKHVIVDCNSVIYVHYMITMGRLCEWEYDKSAKAISDHDRFMNVLIEKASSSCYQMMTKCRKYFESRNVDISFAFDGSQPREKWPSLKRRYDTAKMHRDIVFNLIEKKDKSVNDLKKYISSIPKAYPPADILYRTIQKYLTKAGAKTFEVTGECDKYCSMMVIFKEADALLSTDWDPILFGCPRIIRWVPDSFSLITTVELDEVLQDMNLTLEELRSIFIWSGVDYNHHKGLPDAYDCYRMINMYRDTKTLDEMRDLIDVDEKVMRWAKCKSVYKF